MSPEGLNKVNLSLPLFRYTSERYMSALLDLFPKLHGAKYLILDWRTIETFSSCLNQLSHEPCPFDNLKCLRINARHLKQKQTMPTQVKNYFLENSPNATFIVDLHQVPQKRSLESVCNKATTAKKVAKLDKMKAMFEAKLQMQDKLIAEQKVKLQMQDEVNRKQKEMFEAKIQMQDGVIAEQKAKVQMLEATTLQNEKLMSHIIKSKIGELKVQVEGGNPDYEIIRLIGRDIKSAMELVPEILRAVMESQFLFQYVELKSLLLNRIDASQWARIDTELGSIRDSHSVGS